MMSKFVNAIPSLLAVLYYVLSPFFADLARKGYAGYLEKVDAEYRGSGAALPPHRTSDALGANIEWIIDAPQMVPCLLLPLAAAIFAISSNVASAMVLSVACIVICAATLWIYSRSPLQYRSFRFIGHRYTLVNVLGIVLNLGAAGMLLAYG